ncbi:MAG: T9SS type A sorting domain-containing protein [Lewinellaceae bacterium]|nr:T9SS type A sorting domain-containing protein [Lewinellaceae bacterium]
MIGDNNIITYTYTDVNGCSGSASKIVFIANATVGIYDLDTLPVRIFPNPTTGEISVQGVVVDRIEVMDVHGRTLLSKNHPGVVLDISDLASGIYFLRIMVKDQMVVERVVKE